MFSQPITHNQQTSLTSCLLVTQRLKLPAPRKWRPNCLRTTMEPASILLPARASGSTLYRHADAASGFRPGWDRKLYPTALEYFESVLEQPEWHLNIQTSKRSTTTNSQAMNKGWAGGSHGHSSWPPIAVVDCCGKGWKKKYLIRLSFRLSKGACLCARFHLAIKVAFLMTSLCFLYMFWQHSTGKQHFSRVRNW